MGDRASTPPAAHRSSPRGLALVILIAVAILIAATVGLYARAAAKTNHVALSQSAKPVSTVRAAAAQFRARRQYVGMSDSWNEAKVGPQYVAAYVGSVQYRPGAVVKTGEVLATLDCRFASASSREASARRRAIAERQGALAREARRVQAITVGGFASINELDKLRAGAASEHAEIESLQAALATKTIQVDDCILRAPFDGDVVARFVDPGAYVRPGDPVLAVADRSTIRIVADAPEDDFTIVAPGILVDVDIPAIHSRLRAPISRRTPATDHATRTVHFEIDLADPERAIPIGATAELTIPVGTPQQASKLPSQAATVHQHQASLFVVENDTVHKREVPIIGQRAGDIYLDPTKLRAGTRVVLDGRALLEDGDRVQAHAAESRP
jgi:RND family efflux transporter MFP subunit